MYWKLKVIKRSDSRAGEALEFCEKNLLSNNFSLHFIVFSKRTFYENYSTPDSHTNTAILRLLAFCLPVKMASKTVIRPIYTNVTPSILVLKSGKKKLEREKSGSVFHCKCLADK